MSGKLKEKIIAGGIFAAIFTVTTVDFTSADTLTAPTPAVATSSTAAEAVQPAVASERVRKAARANTHFKYHGKVITVRFDKTQVDRSGAQRVGKASYYADYYAGRKMSDGKLMNPRGRNAASMTLPLGTTAKVTNLATGKSAIVKIQDRGPYVTGRIIDLSPGTAEFIGISKRQGLAKVSVTPIAVPLADGSIKKGAAADDPVVAATLNDESVLPSLGGE